MNVLGMVCPRCKQMSPPGTVYCPNCGEILDANLIAELQRLAVVMRDLDKRIAAGKGDQTVADLREEYYTRYQRIRRARPAAASQSATPPAGEQIPLPPAALSGEATPTPQPVSPARIGLAARLPAIPPDQVAAPLATSVAQPATPAPAPQPAGPVFSWRAFVTEQSIAIMAYLGGFLALIATLTFVVSKSSTLPTLTLMIVGLVYLLFGIAGFLFRNATRLRTVGRVYLAVFALMTPLFALALYRFELQSLNFSVAEMLCISALYATVVYLALAVQTRFITYAYLGWAALIVAAIAYIPWTHSDWQWWVFILGLVTLALLAPRQLLRRQPALTVLAEPAVQVAVLTTIPTVIGVQALGIIGLTQTLIAGAYPTIQVQPAPLALGACILVPITAGWRLVAPGWRPRQQHAILDTIDGFNAVFFAEAVVGVTIWIANLPVALVVRPVAISLAATALFEFGLGLALYRWQPRRRGLRIFLEVLAVLLAGGGTFIVAGDPVPNWPLFIALSAGLAVSVGAALIDGAWWLLVSGFFLTFDYFTLAQNLLGLQVVDQNRATFSFALTLALWCAALALGLRQRTRRLVGPVYLVAFGEALYTLLWLPNHSAGYQLELLLVFTAASFSAGLRERQPVLGNLVTGFFGVLAVQALVVNDRDGLHTSLLALGLTLAALAIRWRWGRVWAPGPYIVALWAVILTASYLMLGRSSGPDWTATGLPYVAWFLLFFGLLATAVALWERQPLVMIAPAVLAFWALTLATNDHAGDIAGVALAFALLALGAALRQWRGLWWGTALQVAAALGSIIVTIRLGNLGDTAPDWRVAFLLAFGLATYLIAVQERQPALTSFFALYALVAGLFLPGPNNLVSTLILTFTLAGCGAILRLPWLRARVQRSYALAPYAAAIGCSILATTRIVPYDAGQEEALLLVFAAVAYLLVLLEGVPLAAGIPLLYALASVFVQQDAHALLPLAIIFAVLGLVVGRVTGAAWSWPFYAAASVAALMTAVLGQSNSSFEAGALFILAVLAYVIALAESRPDVLPVAFVLGGLALAVESNVLTLSKAETILAFIGLGWLYWLGALLWRAIPWLRPRGGFWWVEMTSDPTQPARFQQRLERWGDPRRAGALVHRMAAYLVAGGTALVAIFSPGSFDGGAAQTLATAATLLSFAGMLALLARNPRYHLALYAAGELAALAISWGVRWWGAPPTNIQAFTTAPGIYLLLVGVLLPADRRVANAQRIGQFASLAGALLLMLPVLYQSFTEPDLTFQLVYGLVLLGWSLLCIVLGVGTHSRALILLGSAFVGIDTLSGVGLALRSGISPAVVFALLALLLIGAATWLSLRTRHDTHA